MNHVYYGNTMGRWLASFLIIVGVLILSKIVYWLFKSVFGKMAAKTESKLDDLIVDLIEEPIVFCLTVLGIWYGIHNLTLSEKIDGVLNKGVHFLIVLAITWLIARLLEALFNHYLVPLAERTENELDDLLLPIARKGAKITVWSLGVIVALNNAGYDVAALIAGLGIGGLALAMAAKDTVANIFGGFTIFTDHPFSLRDRVKVAGFDGTVEEIGIRSTRLRTLSGTIVTIPNSKFADSAVENVTLEPSRKIILNLGLTYDTPAEGMQKAMDLLHNIAGADEGLEQKHSVGFNAFGDFAMNIIFIYYIRKDADILGTQTRINMAILSEFNRENLEFAFPTQTIFTKELA